MVPQGLRGHWEGQNTLVVDDIYPGQMLQFKYQIQFSRETVHITQLEKYSGNEVELQGTLTATPM